MPWTTWQIVNLGAILVYCPLSRAFPAINNLFQTRETFVLGFVFLCFALLIAMIYILLLIGKQNRINNAHSFIKELYASLMQSSNMFETSEIPGKKFLEVSGECKKITGFEADEFLSDYTLFEKNIHPDDYPLFHSLHRSKNQPMSQQITIRIIHKDGSIHTVKHIGKYASNGWFKRRRYHAVYIEIDTQFVTEKNYQDVSSLFEQLSKHLREMIWIQSRNPDTMLFVNQPFMDFFQYTSERIQQKPYAYLDLIHPEDLDMVLEELKKMKQNHQPVDLEYRVIQKDNERCWVHARIIPIFDQQGNHYQDFGIATDITRQKTFEKELIYANETLTQLANNIHEILWIRDRYTKNFLFVNDLFERYFSNPVSSFMDNLSLYYDFIYDDDRIWVEKAEDNLFRNGKKFIGEYRLKLADQSIRWVRTQAYPIYNDEGLFYRAVGIIEDITERKNNEMAIKEFAHLQYITANLQKSSLKYKDISQFLVDVVLAVNQLFKVRYCTLMEYERDANIFHLRGKVGLSQQITIPNTYNANNDYLMGYTMLSSDVVISEDIDHESRFHLPEFFTNIDIKSCISVTVSGAEHVYGVLTFYCDNVRSFTNVQINFIQSISSLISEINLRYQTEKALLASENQYRELIELQNTGILILNADGRIRYVNPAAETIFDTPKSFLTGYSFETLLDPENLVIYRSELEKIKHGGETNFEMQLIKTPDFPKDVMVTSIIRVNEKKDPLEIINIIRDITQQKKEEDELVQLTFYDSLTGIFNRSYYENELFRLEVTDFYPVSIIIGDVDNLKGTNDAFGHSMGDKLLVQTSAILKAAFRPGDVIARIGGDEFAVLMPNTNHRMMVDMLERIHQKIRQANKQSDLPFPISISIGGATSLKSNTLRDAIQKADMRMYEEKKKKKLRARNPDLFPE